MSAASQGVRMMGPAANLDEKLVEVHIRATSSTLSRPCTAPENQLAMNLLVADAVLQFGSDLREAREAAAEWARAGR